jgi:hypothetical protein
MESSKERIEAQICAYVDGQLTGDDLAEIERHLANNPQHAALIKELMTHKALLQDLPRATVPGDLNEGLTGQLERHSLLGDDEVRPARSSIFRIHRWPQFAAVAAVFMLAAGLAFVVYYVLPPSGQRAGATVAVADKGLKPQSSPAAPPRTERNILAESEGLSRRSKTGDFDVDSTSLAPANKPLAEEALAQQKMKEVAKDGSIASGPATELQLSLKSTGGIGGAAMPQTTTPGATPSPANVPGQAQPESNRARNLAFYGQQPAAADALATATGIDQVRKQLQTNVPASLTAGLGAIPDAPVLYMVVSTNSPAAVNGQLGEYLKDNRIPYAYSELADTSRILAEGTQSLESRLYARSDLEKAQKPANEEKSVESKKSVSEFDRYEAGRIGSEPPAPSRSAGGGGFGGGRGGAGYGGQARGSNANRADVGVPADSKQPQDASAAGRGFGQTAPATQSVATAESFKRPSEKSPAQSGSIAAPAIPNPDPVSRGRPDEAGKFAEDSARMKREAAAGIQTSPERLNDSVANNDFSDHEFAKRDAASPDGIRDPGQRGLELGDLRARPPLPAGNGLILARMSRRQLSELGMKLSVDQLAQATELKEGRPVALEGITFKVPAASLAEPLAADALGKPMGTVRLQDESGAAAEQSSPKVEQRGDAKAPAQTAGELRQQGVPAPTTRQAGRFAQTPAATQPAPAPDDDVVGAKLTTRSDQPARRPAATAPQVVLRQQLDTRANASIDPMEEPVEVLIVVQSPAPAAAPAPAAEPAPAKENVDLKK